MFRELCSTKSLEFLVLVSIATYLLHATVIVPRGSTYDEAFSI